MSLRNDPGMLLVGGSLEDTKNRITARRTITARAGVVLAAAGAGVTAGVASSSSLVGGAAATTVIGLLMVFTNVADNPVTRTEQSMTRGREGLPARNSNGPSID